ncbi:MAG TPA: asparagine synthase-related protein [Verrucomicrobiota bacterium]|nr:asparagine synthase [Verrucomicrobiales bacterium]HRI14069.1 asparagine synthase-related protein [Verrucomicrobiota bacterium]
MNPPTAYVERVVDLLDPAANRLVNLTIEEARAKVLSGDPTAVAEIDGSFALLSREGKTVRMARSLDRPMRYFLAKRAEGPALIVADRIDAIHAQLQREGLADQFHPSYTRMVPAHHVVEIQLIGCPDPDPIYTRFFTPERDSLPADLDVIGRRYIGALLDEVTQQLRLIPETEPIGIAFSGGVDSGAVFLSTYHALRQLGMSPARLKAFTLSFGDGPDLGQARDFLQKLGLGLFLEEIHADLADLDFTETLRVIEDYKPLDVECATMGLALCRGIRRRYPDWRHLFDGDGGDENLKDYPIEENPELTIRSVVNNLMLYHEGWGVGRIKHSLTYSGGLSRGYVRTYAPARAYGFEGYSPLMSRRVMAVSEGIPFVELTNYDVPTLYSLKGEVVSRGVKQLFGVDMPVFEKRRFQHGATKKESLRTKLPAQEATYRRQFHALYA